MKSTLALFALPAFTYAQQLCGQFESHSAFGFYVNNNEWGAAAGKGDQCTYVDNIKKDGVAWHTDWTWSGGDYNVKSYPYSGRELPTKPLVGNITRLPTRAQWQYNGSNVRANVAYDLFTAADPNHSGSSGDYELMVWVGNLGNVHPIGESRGKVTIDGRSWELFVGNNGDMKVFSFVAPVQVTDFDSDILPFFDHMTKKYKFPAKEQHLITFQFGTEPFTGTKAKFDVWYWNGEVH
ncbi:Xyloglucan-specific endo-beta-1,4-glucanase [Purpureocillium takamizusanense]|uniref:Xyloglucan-specific endo-beta-1,4-glucanase n=1 Tax=Purpureocillium takamizusanense TaxID=2060973 RepID=A0A9Q8Q7V4_9HYPO|nr:Xyloglucan-specific endo-beta-1,4-glucanase [Purpureocillium takamizusanense]UNI15459.1 Xyloglucan-specific endo-beta-1,4-glucanase [Purpureocillium takamizusanense]